MGNYLRIARVYLRGPAAAVWLFLLVCLLAIAANEEIAGHQGGILGGVLSRKSYMAMFAYFNACLLGVLLRDNIAHPWASVLPHYRKKHLLVATLIALFFLAIPMFSMEFVGTSDIAPTSVAVIFLTCLAAGLWTLHHPALGFLAFPFLAFVMTPSSSSAALAAFLAGTNPSASAALIFISLVALWALARRLLALNEDMLVEYHSARVWGDLLRGRGQFGNAWVEGSKLRGLKQTKTKTIEEYLAALPADKRAAVQNLDPLKNPFTNLKQVENLSGYRERSLWQRLQLWRLGTQSLRTSTDVGFLTVMTLLMMPLLMRLFPGRDTVVIFSVQVMTNPFIRTWPSWCKRRHRLGYESLRPRTRQEFVRELGLALLWDIIQCWLGGVLCMGIAAAIWAPEFLQVKNIILFIFCTGVGQLCVVRHDGNLALELETRNGGNRLVRILPVPGDGELDALDDEQPHRRRTEYRDRVGPGRGERGNNRAGLPPLVPGGFGLRMLFADEPVHRGANLNGDRAGSGSSPRRWRSGCPTSRGAKSLARRAFRHPAPDADRLPNPGRRR